MSTERIHPPQPGFKPENYKIRGKAVSDFVDPQGKRIAELNPDEIDPRDIESTCGLTNESQHVEQYDGTLGVTRAFVDAHQAPVGQLQWNNNLATIFTNPGNVNGERWCSGTLIARDLFLSAGHCFDSNPPGWSVPRINGTSNPLPPADIAQNMHINFNFQHDQMGNPRAERRFAITQLLEHRLGGLDYAIVRLEGNPGDVFGTTLLARRDATVGELSAIIGHPAGLPKQIEAGPITAVQANQIRYNDTDTLGGNSGSGVLLQASGEIAGVHTNGGCAGTNPETGFNFAQRIGALLAVSPILNKVALGGWNNPINNVAPNPGSADPDSGVAAVAHSSGVVEVFWIRPDGMVFTNVRNPDLTWNNPINNVAPNPGSADPRSGVAAVAHSSGVVEVFWIRPDGMVFTNVRNPDLTWNNPINNVAPNPGSADPRSGVAAVAHSSGVVEVFWIRPDGMVFTNVRNPDLTWNNPINNVAPNPGSADPDSGVAAVAHSSGVVEVFWIRPDGMVFTNVRNPDLTWNNPINNVAPNPGSADPRSGVAAVAHSSGVVEVFWIRPDGMVFTNVRNPDLTWNNPINNVAPNPGSADPRSGVAAVAHSSGVVEVFWIRPDGMVFTNVRNPDLTWNNPINNVAPNPGSAGPRSGVAAVSHSSGVVEVFWIRPDGMLFTNVRDNP